MKKKFIIPILFIMLIACNQQINKTNGATSESIDFSGFWSIISTKELADFTLSIKQEKDSVYGSHCAVIHGGNRMDCFENETSFMGKISNQAATIKFESSFGGTGNATISYNSQNQLVWKIINSEGELYLPTEAILIKDETQNKPLTDVENNQDVISLNNIEDYFNNIPEEYLYTGINIAQRQNILGKYHNPNLKIDESDLTRNITVKTIDIKNGYIKTEGSGEDVPSSYEVTIFRKPDNNYIVGINKIECGTIGCFYELKFLEYFYEFDKNQWIDITTDVLPELNPINFIKKNTKEKYREYIKNYIGVQYILPQNGTEIEAMFIDHFEPDIDASEIGKTFEQLEYTMFNLSFKDGKFYISKKDKNDGD